MEVFDNLLGSFEVVPRYGGELRDRRLTVAKIAEAVATFLPPDAVQGTGASPDMTGFGWTALGLHARVEEGFVDALGLQLTAEATPAQRAAGVAALLALGALGLILADAEGGEIDLSDATAVKSALKAP